MRESQTKKNPYTLIIGDKEKETNTISYRTHGSNDTTNMAVFEFIEKLLKEIEEKTNTLKS